MRVRYIHNRIRAPTPGSSAQSPRSHGNFERSPTLLDFSRTSARQFVRTAREHAVAHGDRNVTEISPGFGPTTIRTRRRQWSREESLERPKPKASCMESLFPLIQAVRTAATTQEKEQHANISGAPSSQRDTRMKRPNAQSSDWVKMTPSSRVREACAEPRWQCKKKTPPPNNGLFVAPLDPPK